MSETVVSGLADLNQALQTLPAKLEANILRGALRAGANVIKAEIVNNVPVLTGELKKGIKVSTKNKRGKVSATIRTGGKHGFIAKFIEFGTAAHEIKAKNGESLFFGGVFTDKVMHPGIKPKPFMRPALDATQAAALVAFGQYVGKRLNKQGLSAPEVEVKE